jgi:hypothetical protein
MIGKKKLNKDKAYRTCHNLIVVFEQLEIPFSRQDFYSWRLLRYIGGCHALCELLTHGKYNDN